MGDSFGMDMIENAVGFFAGAAGGIGVGGGGILLLYLTAFAGTEQLAAQGINLVFFIPTAAAGLFVHIKNGFVKWRSAAVSVLCGIPGVFFGFYIAGSIDKTLLRGTFALLLLAIGLRELFRKEKE